MSVYGKQEETAAWVEAHSEVVGFRRYAERIPSADASMDS